MHFVCALPVPSNRASKRATEEAQRERERESEGERDNARERYTFSVSSPLLLESIGPCRQRTNCQWACGLNRCSAALCVNCRNAHPE